MATAYLDAGADISPCGRYRTRLWRTWARSPPVLVWCLHNPSTADGATDDATVRRMVGFSALWGYGGISVVNLFAYRATDPRELLLVDDLGGAGDGPLLFGPSDDVIVAWGDVHRTHTSRAFIVGERARRDCRRVRCLGRTKAGQPRHPVRLPYTTPLVLW